MNILAVVCLLQDVCIEHFGQSGSTNQAWMSAKQENCLRIGVGGMLSSSEGSAALWGEALEGFDAVCLGHPDLKDDALLSSDKIRWVSANILRDGKPVAKPFVVCAVGSMKIAVVGVTEAPAAGFTTPKGWTISNPAEALKGILAEAAKNADVVILVAVMDRLACAALLKQFPEIAVGLVSAFGGNDPEPVTLGNQVLVQSPVGAASIGRLLVKFKDRRAVEAQNEVKFPSLTQKDTARIQSMYEKHQVPDVAKRLLQAPPPKVEPETVLHSIEAKACPLGTVRSNRAARLTLHTVRVASEIAGKKAPEGQAWLVLDAEFKNTVPLTYVYQQKVPTIYSIPSPLDYMYVVADGNRLCRLDVPLSSLPGGLLEQPLSLPRLGSVRRGTIVFAVPASELSSLEFRFYDYAQGHMFFPILQTATPRNESPVGSMARNEILQAGVFQVRKADSYGGKKAADGSTFLIVEFRARSVLQVEADATAFDPHARQGQKVKIGAAVDWAAHREHLFAVIDGKDKRPAIDSSLPAEPRFTAEDLTGGTVVFEIPAKYESLELRCEFEQGHVPGYTGVIHPQPMTIALEGKPAKAAGCPKCGAPAGEADKFCGQCGARLKP
jgi:hypothetical protein